MINIINSAPAHLPSLSDSSYRFTHALNLKSLSFVVIPHSLFPKKPGEKRWHKATSSLCSATRRLCHQTLFPLLNLHIHTAKSSTEKMWDKPTCKPSGLHLRFYLGHFVPLGGLPRPSVSATSLQTPALLRLYAHARRRNIC